ncbi:hypothetical protein B0H14DRAFT_2559859 [Mycena olivaceomarginata]|nr:hypothetical protein B0H14DRAFT_2559859 [Mycena olivaceomarginata]
MSLLEAVHEDIAIEEGDGSEDGDDSENGVDIAIEDSNTELARQPRDEESLPESGGDNESDHGFRDLGLLFAFGGRAYATAIIVAPPIVVFAPLLIFWTIVKRLDVEPHKTSWSYALKIFSRIYRMLSLLEGLSYYHTLDHLAWQAGLLSRLFRWIEWAAYAFGVLWLSTDKIGSFFVRRGLAYASTTPEPGPDNAPGGGIPKDSLAPPTSLCGPPPVSGLSFSLTSSSIEWVCAQGLRLGCHGPPPRWICDARCFRDAAGIGCERQGVSQQSTVGIVGNSPRLQVPIAASEAKGEAKLSPLTRADPHITLFGKTSLTSRLQVGPFSRETTSELQACENTHPGSTDKLSRCCTKNKQNSAVVRKCGAEDAEGARRAITAFAASHLEKLVAFSAHVGLQIVTNPNDRKRIFSKKRIHRDVYLGGQGPPVLPRKCRSN